MTATALKGKSPMLTITTVVTSEPKNQTATPARAAVQAPAP